MAQYRKKPVVIEAVQYLNTKEGIAEVLRFVQVPSVGVFGTHITIKTLEGTMRADPSDWIIKGVKGEYYPCKPDIFEATYEPVIPAKIQVDLQELGEEIIKLRSEEIIR